MATGIRLVLSLFVAISAGCTFTRDVDQYSSSASDLDPDAGELSIECGYEGDPCCANPACAAPELHCDSTNVCRTCPYAGFGYCGSGTGTVCNDALECVACGETGQACCNADSTIDESCPGSGHCCSGASPEGGCKECSGPFHQCTCKKCCVTCSGQSAEAVSALPEACYEAAKSKCGAGNVARADWTDESC